MVLEIKNITKNFGGISALKDVSFTIKQGEIYGLIGPNGAGKTTMFNLITNIFEPTSGEIIFLMKKTLLELNHIKLQKKAFVVPIQNIRLFSQMTTIAKCNGWWAFTNLIQEYLKVFFVQNHNGKKNEITK